MNEGCLEDMAVEGAELADVPLVLLLQASTIALRDHNNLLLNMANKTGRTIDS